MYCQQCGKDISNMDKCPHCSKDAKSGSNIEIKYKSFQGSELLEISRKAPSATQGDVKKAPPSSSDNAPERKGGSDRPVNDGRKKKIILLLFGSAVFFFTFLCILYFLFIKR